MHRVYQVIVSKHELSAMQKSLEAELLRHSEQSERISFDGSVPLLFTRDNRVHMGTRIEMRVVMLGLADAGKTSLLFRMKQQEFIQSVPTIGFNVETIEYKMGIHFTVWDVGGSPKLRPLWRHYYANTQAIIYVIDAAALLSCTDNSNPTSSSSAEPTAPTEHSLFLENIEELSRLAREKQLKDACILILANKLDYPRTPREGPSAGPVGPSDPSDPSVQSLSESAASASGSSSPVPQSASESQNERAQNALSEQERIERTEQQQQEQLERIVCSLRLLNILSAPAASGPARSWRLQACSARTGHGVQAALDWLAQQLLVPFPHAHAATAGAASAVSALPALRSTESTPPST